MFYKIKNNENDIVPSPLPLLPSKRLIFFVVKRISFIFTPLKHIKKVSYDEIGTIKMIIKPIKQR